MFRIDEEDLHDTEETTVDQFPSVVGPPPEYNDCDLGNTTNICSSKQTSVQTERTKYHLTNRSASLPSRQSSSPPSINTEENIKQRRRYASDSCNNNKHLTASIVTSFLQYLRSELRATTHDQTNDYERIKTMESSDFHQYRPQSLSMALDSSSQLANDTSLNLLHHDDENKEISTLINLLILRVECLANTTTLIETNKKPNIYPSIKQIDQNLTEYLYYLFNKFTKDDPEIGASMIDKTNFVNVCQTLVRNGCFNMPSSTSPDQSYSEATLTNSNELTLIQPAVREYKPDADEMTLDKSSIDETISLIPMSDQDTWLVVDLEPFKPQYSIVNPNEAKCLLPTSTSDDQLLLTNENYFSFEEIKSSCGSESSHSNYFSPNSSLVDLQTMVQEFDEINNNNHNNNNNNSLFNEGKHTHGSTSIEHVSNNTNVIIGEKDHPSNNDICTGLTNEQSTIKSNEQVASSSSSPTMETAEQMTININGTKYRRDKKLQERWTITTKNETPNQNPPVNKANLGVEFPPIAVLRRKFSTLPAPTILNPVPIKRKDSSTIKSKGHSYNTEVNNPSEDNINKANTSNPSISSEIQEIRATPTTPPIILIEDVPKSDQQSNDAASLINNQETKHDTDHSIVVDQTNNPITTLEMKEELSPSSSSQHGKESTDISGNQQKTTSSDIVTDLFALNSTFSSSSSSSTTNTDETKTNEFLLKETVVEEEEEEKEKKEEEKAYYHGDNIDVKEKNNTTVERNYHASGMLLINDEPTQTLLLGQEKKEQHSTPSLTAEACNQQRPQNDCSMEILSSELDTMINVNVEDNEQRYKTIEIEEIPDEEEEQEVLLAQNNLLIEPIDYIVTDDEPRKSAQNKIKPTVVGRDNPLEFDPVISCYEKVLSKVAETMGDSTNTTLSDSSVSAPTDRNRRAEEDPIALRALQRFEQRMSAAVAAKTTSEEIGSTSTRSKSSWSGTSTTPRKSVENLFKNNPQLPPTSVPSNEDDSPTKTSPRQRDTFIRPRKSMLDDVGLSFNRTMNIINAPTVDSSKDNHGQCEEQQQPMDISEDANDRGKCMQQTAGYKGS
ncbi:unnamed protein product [Adineta ricciae]|uniref:Uncharacterized protein n=2 Tax=Adineta ricciae TaxID=249248 RepID=A0A814TMC0_ADIRI|nr:unnamed protein product [Adineta ricciae]